MIACPLDGATLIQHQSHRWPCMERGGCGCPTVATCPECRARAIRAASEGRGVGIARDDIERLEARALMQRSFEARVERSKAQKRARGAEQ